MPGVGKDKDAILGLCQDGSRLNKRDKTVQYCDPRWGNWSAESDKAMGQRVWVQGSQLEATSQKENNNTNQNRLILGMQNYLSKKCIFIRREFPFMDRCMDLNYRNMVKFDTV